MMMIEYVRFQVLTTASMKTASTSETSAEFYEATRCKNPEDSHLHRLCNNFNVHTKNEPLETEMSRQNVKYSSSKFSAHERTLHTLVVCVTVEL
jgi:thiaminase